jgi:large subunit ribosomal protein L4
MKLSVYNFENKEVLSEGEFGIDAIMQTHIDDVFLRMYYRRMLAQHHSERKAKTKNQSEVSGTTRKPYKQKGTGNARRGTMRAAHHRGGGTMFGPRGLTRNISVPKADVRLAKKMLIAIAIAGGKLFVVDTIKLPDYKTKNTVARVRNFSQKDYGKVLILHAGDLEENNIMAAKNLSYIKYSHAKDFGVHDLWHSDAVIVSKEAVDQLINSCC